MSQPTLDPVPEWKVYKGYYWVSRQSWTGQWLTASWLCKRMSLFLGSKQQSILGLLGLSILKWRSWFPLELLSLYLRGGVVDSFESLMKSLDTALWNAQDIHVLCCVSTPETPKPLVETLGWEPLDPWCSDSLFSYHLLKFWEQSAMI